MESMTERATCPACGAAAGVLLTGPSRIAHMDYYRCDECRQVWTVTRDESRTITLVKFHRLP